MALLEKTRVLEERLAAIEEQQAPRAIDSSSEMPDLVPADFSDSSGMFHTFCYCEDQLV
jgi:hypothetical protein